MASGRPTDWAQSLTIGLNMPTSAPTFGRGAFTPTISGRRAMSLSGSGRVLNVDGLLRKYDEQPNRLTDAQIIQQQMREFTRLLVNGQNEKQENGQLHLVSAAIWVHRLIS